MARLRWPSRRASSAADAPGRRRFRDTRTGRFLHRHRLLRDTIAAILLVGVVLVAGLTWAGGVWPPVLAVESGSMMHASTESPYGRIGTIDVGDLVFVRAVDDVRDVELWVHGGEDRYGRPGDVIAFAPDGDHSNTTVLHRAITYITVEFGEDGRARYSFPWVDGDVRRFGPEGIYFPALSFDEEWGFTPRTGYRPLYSGFVTKGDNAFTNPVTDQAASFAYGRGSRLVEPTWIVGTVHGEVPWLGLAKLALQSDQTNPAQPGWERVGNAFAPVELWSMFFLVVTVVILVPFAIATVRIVVLHRRTKREMERQRAADAARERERARLAAAAPAGDASRRA